MVKEVGFPNETYPEQKRPMCRCWAGGEEGCGIGSEGNPELSGRNIFL